jgi:hypothetical protein
VIRVVVLRPEGRVRSSWLAIVTSAEGEYTFIHHEVGEGFAHEQQISVSQALRLSARMGVS